MTNDTPQVNRMDYWEQLDASQQTVVEAIDNAEQGWTVHAVVISGESADDLFATVIRSREGDEGLLLSERMVRIPKEISDPSEIGMLDNTITRRVCGPLAQALLKGYARADNDGLDPDEQDAPPLTLDARGELSEDPSELLDGIGEDPHERRRKAARESSTEYVECVECGEQAEKSDAVNLGSALGKDSWVHAGPCGGGDE